MFNQTPGMADAEELLQVVDDADRPIGSLCRGDIHAEHKYHRAVHVLLFNTLGHIYLQRRSTTKDTWAGYWDSSCAGHVRGDEPYDEAADRELMEELGVAGALKRLGKIDACDATENEFVVVYTLIHDGDVHPNADEIDEGRFFPIEQVRFELMRKIRPFTPSFSSVFRLYAATSPTLI